MDELPGEGYSRPGWGKFQILTSGPPKGWAFPSFRLVSYLLYTTMSTKDSTPREWPDPTDFGLPFVEITPLSAAKPSPKVEAAAPAAPLPKQEDAPKSTKKEEKETKKPRPITLPTSPPKVKKPASRAWVGFVVFGFLALVSVIVWQIQSGGFALPEVKKEQPSDSPVALAKTNTVAPVDTAHVPMVSGVDSAAVVAASNSGTAIASQTPGSLIRINSKEANRRFFIIIGSFVSEEEALKYIKNSQSKFPEYHLISPYAESKNFRLAVGKYASLKDASNELARIKSEYPIDLWILNY